MTRIVLAVGVVGMVVPTTVIMLVPANPHAIMVTVVASAAAMVATAVLAWLVR